MKSILVAVDASPSAMVVLQAGVDLARTMHAKVRLLRAVGVPADVPPTAWASPPTQIVDGFILVAKRDLAELAALVPSALLEASTVEVGAAWDVICSHAREHEVSMIVIGAPGHGFFDRLVGTTAAKVVNHADRPVLVVPTTSARQAAA